MVWIQVIDVRNTFEEVNTLRDSGWKCDGVTTKQVLNVIRIIFAKLSRIITLINVNFISFHFANSFAVIFTDKIKAAIKENFSQKIVE